MSKHGLISTRHKTFSRRVFRVTTNDVQLSKQKTQTNKTSDKRSAMSVKGVKDRSLMAV